MKGKLKPSFCKSEIKDQGVGPAQGHVQGHRLGSGEVEEHPGLTPSASRPSLALRFCVGFDEGKQLPAPRLCHTRHLHGGGRSQTNAAESARGAEMAPGTQALLAGENRSPFLCRV